MGEASLVNAAVTKLARCAGADERFATLDRDEVVALLEERTALLVTARDAYGQKDVDWFADNADEYFDKWQASEGRITAALEALNDGEQWCTERVVRAIASLAAAPSQQEEK